jgi:hypothetical protein
VRADQFFLNVRQDTGGRAKSKHGPRQIYIEINCGASLMRQSSYPATGILSSAAARRTRRPSRRKSLFAILFDALHESRRLQAELIVRRYQHLIVRAQQRSAEKVAATESHADGSE